MRLVLYSVGFALTAIGLVGLGVVALGPASLTEPAPVAGVRLQQPTERPAPRTPAAAPTLTPTLPSPTVSSTALPEATAPWATPPVQPTAVPIATTTLTVSILAPSTVPPAPTSGPTQPPQQPAVAAQPTSSPPPQEDIAGNDSAKPITWLALPRIGLQTTVVPAVLVQDGDSVTWEIPKYVAGHAESSAGAGEVGNAVILGHLVSRTLGNVFEHLDRARPGDLLRVRSGSQEFDYTIIEVTTVDRTDVEVLDPTSNPTITLITCAGLWNPVLHDYMERLIVRGQFDPANQ